MVSLTSSEAPWIAAKESAISSSCRQFRRKCRLHPGRKREVLMNHGLAFGLCPFEKDPMMLTVPLPLVTGWLECPAEFGEGRAVAPRPPPERPGERGLPRLGGRILDLRHTFEFLSTGASLVRLQLEDFQWLKGVDPDLRAGFNALLQGRLGKSCCMAVDDVLSRNWELQVASERLKPLQKPGGISECGGFASVAPEAAWCRKCFSSHGILVTQAQVASPPATPPVKLVAKSLPPGWHRCDLRTMQTFLEEDEGLASRIL
eukprot:s3628_g3.t1